MRLVGVLSPLFLLKLDLSRTGFFVLGLAIGVMYICMYVCTTYLLNKGDKGDKQQKAMAGAGFSVPLGFCTDWGQAGTTDVLHLFGARLLHYVKYPLGLRAFARLPVVGRLARLGSSTVTYMVPRLGSVRCLLCYSIT